nr:ATP-dependent helicase [Lachnospiraceae bacterium]
MNKTRTDATPRQWEAITFAEGTMLVLAGPGSGKTYVITRRIRYLIEEENVDPAHILTITFTKAAALEMKERCHQICPASAGAVFGTFHSVFYHILKSSSEYQHFSVISEQEKVQIAKKILSGFRDASGYSSFAPEDFLQKLSCYKNCRSQLPEENESFLKAVERYDKACMDLKKMDFDHMLCCCLELFSTYPAEKERWQKRFRYLLVDEFQDVNGLQYELLKILAEQNRNLFAVGDDDQAIYSFRGSNPAYMNRFLEDYPNCRQILLDQNYRCGSQIVTAASKCIVHNQCRFPKEIKAVQEFENTVQIHPFESLKEEMQFLEKQITAAKGEEITAILLRTNAVAEEIAEYLSGIQKTFSWNGKRKNKCADSVLQTVVAILKFVHCGNRRSDFLVFMNKPYRGVLREDLESEVVDLKQLQKVYHAYGEIKEALCLLERDCNFLKKMDPFGAVNYILSGMKYQDYMLENAKSETEQIRIRERIGSLKKQAKKFRTIKHFLEHMQEDDIWTEQKKMPQESRNEKVRIMTYHAAKGLEFDHVILPEVNGGMVPKGNMLTPDQMEEERRMFYVAMTRAKKSLHICWRKDCAGQGESVFIKELLDQSNSSNSALSKYSSKASETASYSESSSMKNNSGSAFGSFSSSLYP